MRGPPVKNGRKWHEMGTLAKPHLVTLIWVCFGSCVSSVFLCVRERRQTNTHPIKSMGYKFEMLTSFCYKYSRCQRMPFLLGIHSHSSRQIFVQIFVTVLNGQ